MQLLVMVYKIGMLDIAGLTTLAIEALLNISLHLCTEASSVKTAKRLPFTGSWKKQHLVLRLI